jgi:uncharacterized membrane protein HdeD (DUF308 family)
MSLVLAIGFGVMFIYYGVRRIVHAKKEKNPREAVVWGGFGVVLGFAVCALLAWFFFGPDDDRRSNWQFGPPMMPDMRDSRVGVPDPYTC